MNRMCNRLATGVLVQEEFEDTEGYIRIRKSKKGRQHNGQKKKDKQRSTKHTQELFLKRVVCTKLDIYVFIKGKEHYDTVQLELFSYICQVRSKH